MKALIVWLGLAVGSLTAGRAIAQAPETKKVTLAVGGKSLLYYLPVTIAERKGYFKDEGLEVEIPDFAGGAKSLQALIGGSADVVSGSYEHTISMQAKGQKVIAFVVQGNAPGIALAVRKDKAAAVKSGKDLAGFKIGVTAPGSSTNMFVNTLLAKDGLKPDAVSIVGVGPGAGAVAAMQKGELEAISNLDPVISQLEAAAHAVILFDTRTEKGNQEVYGGVYHAATLYTTEAFLRRNPNTVQALTNAMVRGLKWLARATPDDVLALVPPEYWGADKELYRTALKKNFGSYSKDGRFSMESAERVMKVLKAFDATVQHATIDLSRTFDDGFTAKANEKYH
ncbi:MAG TPA: ABC transporter substrate-binding protein [Anaeromyxobacter sp.]